MQIRNIQYFKSICFCWFHIRSLNCKSSNSQNTFKNKSISNDNENWEIFSHELRMNNDILLTLFTWIGLLSSTGSAAAALTLNRTPMRAANTTRSCMLWQECKCRTRATVTPGWQRQECVNGCLREREKASEQLRPARDPEERAGKSAVQLVAAGHRIWEPGILLLLYLQSPWLFYIALSVSATDVEGGGCMTEGECVRVFGGWMWTWVWKRRG